MTDQEFQAMTKRIEQGETLPVMDRFLYDREQQRREIGPNILEQQNAARQENPLLSRSINPLNNMGRAADKRESTDTP